MHSHIVFTLDVSFTPTNEKRLDNATLDVSSHQERKYFKHTQIQGIRNHKIELTCGATDGSPSREFNFSQYCLGGKANLLTCTGIYP